jgi:hypothetical protein
MFNAHIIQGQGDEESVAEVHDGAPRLPRSIAQTFLLNEMDETITTVDQSQSASSSSSDAQAAPFLAVPVSGFLSL